MPASSRSTCAGILRPLSPCISRMPCSTLTSSSIYFCYDCTLHKIVTTVYCTLLLQLYIVHNCNSCSKTSPTYAGLPCPFSPCVSHMPCCMLPAKVDGRGCSQSSKMFLNAKLVRKELCSLETNSTPKLLEKACPLFSRKYTASAAPVLVSKMTDCRNHLHILPCAYSEHG